MLCGMCVLHVSVSLQSFLLCITVLCILICVLYFFQSFTLPDTPGYYFVTCPPITVRCLYISVYEQGTVVQLPDPMLVSVVVLEGR